MTDEEELNVELWILDAMLTGKNPLTGRGGMAMPLVPLEDFIEGASSAIYYMSDGGYSRLRVHDGVLRLTSDSRQEVKDRWHDLHIQSLRQRINAHIKRLLDNS